MGMASDVVGDAVEEIVKVDEDLVVLDGFVLWKFVRELIVGLVDLCKIVDDVVEIVYDDIEGLDGFCDSLWEFLVDCGDFFAIIMTALFVLSTFFSIFYLNFSLW